MLHWTWTAENRTRTVAPEFLPFISIILTNAHWSLMIWFKRAQNTTTCSSFVNSLCQIVNLFFVKKKVIKLEKKTEEYYERTSRKPYDLYHTPIQIWIATLHLRLLPLCVVSLLSLNAIPNRCRRATALQLDTWKTFYRSVRSELALRAIIGNTVNRQVREKKKKRRPTRTNSDHLHYQLLPS